MARAIRWVVELMREVDHGLAVARGDSDARTADSWRRAAATAATVRGLPTPPYNPAAGRGVRG